MEILMCVLRKNQGTRICSKNLFKAMTSFILIEFFQQHDTTNPLSLIMSRKWKNQHLEELKVSSRTKPLTKAKIALLGPLTVSFVAKVLANSSRLVHPLGEYFCSWFF
jgi:hypothetical protein